MLQTIEDTAPSKKGNGLHYAFIICLGGFLTQAIVLSCQRLPAVALEPIRQTLGVSYADVGLITSVFMIFYAGLSIVWGMLGDKIGTRWAMTIACGLASIGALLFGFFAQYGLRLRLAPGLSRASARPACSWPSCRKSSLAGSPRIVAASA